ncbi:hypothetical protein LguiA_027696 [Lonicera macranthoides]
MDNKNRNRYRKSFKSHGSYKHHSPKGSGDDSEHNYQRILSDHPRDDNSATTSSVDDLHHRREVIVKIDADDNFHGDDKTGSPSTGIWREPSCNEIANDDGFKFQQPKEATDDPPSKLISQFLNMQRDAGGELTLDMDMEMEELRPLNLSPTAQNPRRSNDNNRDSNFKEARLSFEALNIEPELIEELHNETSSSNDDDTYYHSRISPAVDDNGGGEILRGTPSFQRRQSSRWTKTQSRLMDPPNPLDVRSEVIAKSGPIRSGLLGRNSGLLGKPAGEEEEDDPLFDEDIPDDFKKGKLDALTVIQWIGLVFIVTALICTLIISKWKERTLRGLQYWKWEVLVLVLICGQLVSGWGIRIGVFFIERNFLLRKRLLYFVYGIRKAVQNCIWLGLVLLAWHLMFDKKVEADNKFLMFMNKVMVCMLVAILLWLVKTLMVKVLASSFHVSTYFDRIQESLFNQYLIETLSGPPLIEIQNNQEEDDRIMSEILKLEKAGANLPSELKSSAFQAGRSDRAFGSVVSKQSRGSSIKFSGTISKQDEGITIDHLHRLNPDNVSAWNMKRLMNIVRNGTLSTLDEQILGSTQDDESTTQIRSEREAKVAARKIFRNVAKPRNKFIYLDDLMRFLREEEALKTMNLFEELSECGKISKSALKNWVVNAFRERRALALTLNDTKTAVNKLHQIVNVLVGIIILIIWLVILGIATSKVLLFVSSQIVVVAFIFGNTCKMIFEAIIFLFVMHPFDVGDRCEIDGVQMIVEEMNILNTVFLKFDNLKIIFPNSTLATKAISNYYRSPDMGDSVEFHVHIATPAEKIAAMKQRIEGYVDNKKDHWYSSPMIVLMDLVELNAMKMSVWLRHKINHQDMGERWIRRALLVQEMVEIFKELDIEYRLHPIDINIRTMPIVNSTRLPPSWTDSSAQ